MPSTIRGILFDLDGVVRTFDPAREAAIEARHGLPRGTLWPVLFERERLHKAVTGKLTDEAWRDDAAAELARTIGPHAAAALRELGTSPGVVNLEVLALVRELRKRFPIGMLTNGTSRLQTDLATLDLSNEFDVIVSSSAIGCRKPEPAAYLEAARQLSLPPSQILFIDDTPGHITGAQAVGMSAIHFTSPSQLRTALLPFLLQK